MTIMERWRPDWKQKAYSRGTFFSGGHAGAAGAVVVGGEIVVVRVGDGAGVHGADDGGVGHAHAEFLGTDCVGGSAHIDDGTPVVEEAEARGVVGVLIE